MTSSLFSFNAIVSAENFTLESGSPKTSTVTGESGTVSSFKFCDGCGSVLWTEWPEKPELRIVKAGLLDGDDVLDGEHMKPRVEQFTARRPGWLCAVNGVAQFEGQQPMKEADRS